MSIFTASLLKIEASSGGGVSYIKAVQHLGHNVCDRTIDAFNESSLYLHETCLDLVESGAQIGSIKGTEYLLGRKLMNKSTVHLDSVCEDISHKFNMRYPISDQDKEGIFEKYQTDSPVTDAELADIMITFETEVMDPEYYDLLIVQRNKRWMQIILMYLKQGDSCFVLCGAAHVNDLVVRLEIAGYKISRIRQGELVVADD